MMFLFCVMFLRRGSARAVVRCVVICVVVLPEKVLVTQQYGMYVIQYV